MNTLWGCSDPSIANDEIRSPHRFPKYKIKSPIPHSKPANSKKTSLKKWNAYNKSAHHFNALTERN